MARPYRLQGEGLLYHITSRGDDRKKIFLSKYDYHKFFEYLDIARGKFDFYLYAYCLMGNHYHLLLETNQPNISRIMQYINTAYTVYYNKKRGKCGHVFQGRFKSMLVDGDTYLLELTRYVHLNPVRAKIVGNPKDYPWSSYHHYLNKRKSAVIDIHALEERYLTIRMPDYQHYVEGVIGRKVDIFNQAYSGFILGRQSFVKNTIDKIKSQVEEQECSYKNDIIKFRGHQEIINAVADHYKVSSQHICSHVKRPLEARKVAIYLIKRYTNLTNKEIGQEFGICYSGVSKIAGMIGSQIKEDKDLERNINKISSHFKV